jgi:hypothetical protein
MTVFASKGGLNEGRYDFFRRFDTDGPGPKGQDIAMVVLDHLMRGIDIVSQGRPHTR